MMAQLYVIDTDQLLLTTGSYGAAPYSYNAGTAVTLTLCGEGQQVVVRTDARVPREMHGDAGEDRVSSFSGVLLSIV